MIVSLSQPCTAFEGARLMTGGALIDVALAVKAALDADPAVQVLVFDDATGAVIDLDLRGTTAEIVARLTARMKETPPSPSRQSHVTAADSTRDSTIDSSAPRGRGRPKLGVVAREITLLPRHWDWLATQPGSASQVLRRLIDDARRAKPRRDQGANQARAAQDTAYRFMLALAGNFPGFEEATRALFAGDRDRFAAHTQTWPADVRGYAFRLAWGTMSPDTNT